ncbi:MAG: glycosyl hydrolase 108 family protein [Chitinophagia bacterium]
MANFKLAHKNTLSWEGGYVDMPEDNGNWTGAKRGIGVLIGTNKGITAWRLKDYLGRTPTVDEMKNLSDEVAEAIYKQHYWGLIKGDEIIDQDIANDIYDSAVNMGPYRSIVLAQRTLGITETGKMDDDTLRAINNLP